LHDIGTILTFIYYLVRYSPNNYPTKSIRQTIISPKKQMNTLLSGKYITTNNQMNVYPKLVCSILQPVNRYCWTATAITHA